MSHYLQSRCLILTSVRPRIATTGGDTLFTSQVAALRRLSPQFVAFLRTLKAVHSGLYSTVVVQLSRMNNDFPAHTGVEQAEFSRTGKRGGVVRRQPVEHM